jgi:hypothetical protein
MDFGSRTAGAKIKPVTTWLWLINDCSPDAASEARDPKERLCRRSLNRLSALTATI